MFCQLRTALKTSNRSPLSNSCLLSKLHSKNSKSFSSLNDLILALGKNKPKTQPVNPSAPKPSISNAPSTSRLPSNQNRPNVVSDSTTQKNSTTSFQNIVTKLSANQPSPQQTPPASNRSSSSIKGVFESLEIRSAQQRQTPPQRIQSPKPNNNSRSSSMFTLNNRGSGTAPSPTQLNSGVIVKGLDTREKGGSNTTSETEEVDSNNPEMTDGERRYLQHTQHLQKKQEKYRESLGIDSSSSSPPSRFQPRNNYQNNNNQHQYHRQQNQNQQEHHQPNGNSSFSLEDFKNRIQQHSQNRFGGGGGGKDGQFNRFNNNNNNNSNRNPSSNSSSSSSSTMMNSGKEKKPQQRTVQKRAVTIPYDGLIIRELASLLGLKIKDLVKKIETLDSSLLKSSSSSSVDGQGQGQEDQVIESIHLDAELCELVVLELGLVANRESKRVHLEDSKELREQLKQKRKEEASSAIASGSESLLASQIHYHPRAPAVCIMGHVDHGKTTLLDTIRSANVAAGEAGGITQRLSAFSVTLTNRDNKQVVFLDTPGHAAFTSMRTCGAAATDVVVLVVAIDDGVRPQTIEALKLAQESKLPIVIALNKIDKVPVEDRKAARLRVLTQLTDYELVAEDFGGETQVVEVAGKTGEGLDSLMESVLLQADMLELSAATEGHAEAVVLDANMDKTRGPVADVLVKWGKLSVGDEVVVGTAQGRVRSIIDYLGVSHTSVGPSSPVRIQGLKSVPVAGEELLSVDSEDKARQIVDRRTRMLELRQLNSHQPSSSISSSTPDSSSASSSSSVPIPHMNLLIKADSVGALEALQKIVKSLSSRTRDVTISIIDQGIGPITKSEIEKAQVANQATILGFNIDLLDRDCRSLAKELDVMVVKDTVIYRLEDHLLDTMKSKMPKHRILVPEGTAQVLKTFQIKDRNDGFTVAGLSVTSGTVRMDSGNNHYVYRVKRGENVIQEEIKPSMLKHFKDHVHQVEQGKECGLALDGFSNYNEGDVIECLKITFEHKQLKLDPA